MKLNRMILAAALALGSLLVLNTVSQAQEAKEGKKRGPSVDQQLERMTEQLKLTDAQKPKVKAVLEETQKKMEALRGQTDLSQEQRREKFTAARDEQSKKLNEILTPEQQEKWKTMRDEMRKKGGQKKAEKKAE